MNNSQVQIIKLLNLAIHGEKLKDFKEISKWDEIIEEAKAHEISALIYSAIYGIKSLDGLSKERLDYWKKTTFFTGIGQISHYNQVGKLFEKFNEENIDVIVLKGLVVRELYPKSEFRTMGDADILVHEEDLERVTTLLQGLGYKLEECEDEHGAHLVFSHEKYRHVEVHWTLVNDDYFLGTKEFEKSIWANSMKINIGEAEVLSLGWEDLALHLCLHMAVHIVWGGFGLRQLCDLVLLVEQKGNEINWESFMIKGIECGAEKFILAIFKCCEKLFNMEIPSEVENSGSVDENLIDDLIQNIFNSGVFGKKDVIGTLGADFAYSKDEKEKKRSISEKYLELVFPKVENMSEKYQYAQNNKILTPIAWAHHLGAGVFNKDYSLKSKIRFLTKSVSVSKKKRELLEELNLTKK
ncbi:nucleotidyltransferase family protein [Clostridium sp. LIBA-8841]|uniref:nucleotidyltransferase domain-containing protein n=1 Tax=Clostridium sp. LIBA-8841 TaxID=2987530 RepID=UPI002AC61467|nr:nucleotidyltransferase family protein [Clostridium sp. LIBA-8841]MDZ5254396.1 nucleotidyltransferase family protein [Clostridium sp. LIBA-8841]